VSAMRYLHIGVNWVGPPRTGDVNRLIDDKSVTADWFFYSDNCWVIYTAFTAVQWANYLHRVIGAEDHLIILEITDVGSMGGWLPRWAWEWFLKDRSNLVGQLVSGSQN
jgi:hypothetical protein